MDVEVVDVEFVVVVELTEEVAVGSGVVVLVVVDVSREVVFRFRVELVIPVRLVELEIIELEPDSELGSELTPTMASGLGSESGVVPKSELEVLLAEPLGGARLFTKRLRAAWSRRLTPPEA